MIIEWKCPKCNSYHLKKIKYTDDITTINLACSNCSSDFDIHIDKIATKRYLYGTTLNADIVDEIVLREI